LGVKRTDLPRTKSVHENNWLFEHWGRGGIFRKKFYLSTFIGSAWLTILLKAFFILKDDFADR